jgi:hypothetical protein
MQSHILLTVHHSGLHLRVQETSSVAATGHLIE